MQVRLGNGQAIPGFEEALIGMPTNEEKEVILPPEKAHGKSAHSETIIREPPLSKPYDL